MVEDMVLRWFRDNGFFAERSHFGGKGYAEMFSEVVRFSSWDVESLRQQFRDSQDSLYGDLGAQGLVPEDAIEAIRASAELENEERLVLVQSMTREQVVGCHNAIFDSYDDEEGTFVDEFKAAPGAPDLFVWHSNPQLHLWFFCEVKAYRDYLKQSQHEWLRHWWSSIGGRVVLVALDNANTRLCR